MSEPQKPEQVTIRTEESGELTFDVLRTGPRDAPQLIALHGFPQGARAWNGVATRLAERGVGTIAIDQRGYSPNARPVGVEHYRDALLASDVMAIADALGLATFHLAGHDWGSHVAWVTAATYPDRVSTLSAVSIPHPTAFGRALREDADQQTRSQYIRLFWQPEVAEAALLGNDAQALRDALQDVDEAEIDHYVGRLQQPGALTAALSWYRAMRLNGNETPKVTVPTTYVWSDNDSAIGRRGAELCVNEVEGDYRFVELAGVTHWIPERAPEPLANAIAARVLGTA